MKIDDRKKYTHTHTQKKCNKQRNITRRTKKILKQENDLVAKSKIQTDIFIKIK